MVDLQISYADIRMAIWVSYLLTFYPCNTSNHFFFLCTCALGIRDLLSILMSPAESTNKFQCLLQQLACEFWQLLFSHAGNLQAAKSDTWWHSNMLPTGIAIFLRSTVFCTRTMLSIHAILLLK